MGDVRVAGYGIWGMVTRPATEHLWKVIMLSVRVPVLSMNT